MASSSEKSAPHSAESNPSCSFSVRSSKSSIGRTDSSVTVNSSGNVPNHPVESHENDEEDVECLRARIQKGDKCIQSNKMKMKIDSSTYIEMEQSSDDSLKQFKMTGQEVEAAFQDVHRELNSDLKLYLSDPEVRQMASASFPAAFERMVESSSETNISQFDRLKMQQASEVHILWPPAGVNVKLKYSSEFGIANPVFYEPALFEEPTCGKDRLATCQCGGHMHGISYALPTDNHDNRLARKFKNRRRNKSKKGRENKSVKLPDIGSVKSSTRILSVAEKRTAYRYFFAQMLEKQTYFCRHTILKLSKDRFRKMGRQEQLDLFNEAVANARSRSSF